VHTQLLASGSMILAVVIALAPVRLVPQASAVR
jgi:hypothetical protein